jgi:hypothetical protein
MGWRHARTDANNSPFWDRRVTLGRVKDGLLHFVKNKGDKLEVLRRAAQDMDSGAVFLVAWTGEWSTDLFEVTKDDVARWLKEMKEC